MKLEQHLALSAVFSGALYGVFRSWELAVSAFIGGVFTDLDHFLDYFLDFGLKFDLKRFFRASYRREYRRSFLVLHSWELAFVLAAAAWWSRGNPWLVGLALGWAQHLLVDHIANRPTPWAYFLVRRWRHRFDHHASFPKKEE